MFFSAPTVLVAEHDALCRRKLRRDLIRAGARVAEVGDGEEVVRRIVEGASFDLALLALDLPRMDGVTAAWLPRQKGRIVCGGTVRTVVGMTEGALPAAEDAVWFDALIAKPLSRDRLDGLLEGFRESVVDPAGGFTLQVTG